MTPLAALCQGFRRSNRRENLMLAAPMHFLIVSNPMILSSDAAQTGGPCEKNTARSA
jgi:hypothetical protein